MVTFKLSKTSVMSYVKHRLRTVEENNLWKKTHEMKEEEQQRALFFLLLYALLFLLCQEELVIVLIVVLILVAVDHDWRLLGWRRRESRRSRWGCWWLLVDADVGKG